MLKGLIMKKILIGGVVLSSVLSFAEFQPTENRGQTRVLFDCAMETQATTYDIQIRQLYYDQDYAQIRVYLNPSYPDHMNMFSRWDMRLKAIKKNSEKHFIAKSNQGFLLRVKNYIKINKKTGKGVVHYKNSEFSDSMIIEKENQRLELQNCTSRY
jgi:hypothetical protein